MNTKKLGKWAFIILGGLLVIFVGLLVICNLLEGRIWYSFNAINDPIFRSGMPLLSLSGLVLILFKLIDGDSKKKSGPSVSQYYSNRWMTDSERDKTYIYTKASQLNALTKTGPLARFELVNNDIHINMIPKDYHSIILGTTGAAKTQGYVFPFIYTLGFSNQKPNLVITDPKGEIYHTMAESLRNQGYDVQVFNLNDPIRSSRWNPFDKPWDMFQRAQHLEREIRQYENASPTKLGLRVIASSYPPVWYAFNGIAFPTKEMAENEMRTLRQQLISDAEADVKDICSAICPIENEKDPSWEQGARDLIQGTAMAMLEDSLNPNLGMTREKFNFYNIFKILSIRDNDPQAMFKTIKNYFEGRDKLSVAASLAQTVTANAENTMRNFFGIATQKLSMFNDKGICYITSGTDIKFEDFAKKPTVFFLIIPDQIKVRHPLATLCISQLYKSLVASANERGGKLPWPTYFVLDEFGNMPKVNDFATVITVSRSRRIFFTLVLQDYKQLETTYGAETAVTVRNNCNH
ncbi:MAG: type IV secretory system conjugative DNA transfer family protein, partial [Clostridia bacterium]|nr:type IV secretory system conjugative DNA transfer family protein [Clostridia bacterium]